MPDRLMGIFSRLLILVAALLWQAVPAPAADLNQALAAVPNPRVDNLGWVSDPAGAIRARQADINALIDEFERQTGVEIAVVVLPSIGQLNAKEFATALFNHWGIGKQEPDNGILVLQVLDQRRVEIETGYGVEGSLPDVKCNWIIEDIAIPFFRAGSLSDGHYELVRALIAGIRNPDASRAQLTGGTTLAPGASVDPPPADYRPLRLDDPATPDLASTTATPAQPGGLVLSLLAGGLALFPVLALLVRRHRLANPDPHEQWTYFDKRSWLAHAGMALAVLAGGLWELQGRDSVWSLLSLLPGGFLSSRYVRHRLRQLRDRPRLDPNTGETMRRLDERADDAYLKAGQITEERIKSVDYDVWLSPSGYYRIEHYDGTTEAETCPSCGYKTSRNTSVRVLVEATSYSEGAAEDIYTCANCGNTRIVKRVLDRISSSSSSSGYDSSSGSFGGGSFGGGSSGGGGAGGSY